MKPILELALLLRTVWALDVVSDHAEDAVSQHLRRRLESEYFAELEHTLDAEEASMINDLLWNDEAAEWGDLLWNGEATAMDNVFWSGQGEARHEAAPSPRRRASTRFRAHGKKWRKAAQSHGNASADTHTPSEDPAAAPKRVEVFGLQNTGTNLMMRMLSMNFGMRLAFYDGSFSDADSDTRKRPGIWKHANLRVKEKYDAHPLQALEDQGVVFVFMVRNPLAWLQSMRKAPYELANCTEGKHWLTHPCVHPFAGGFHSSTPKIVFPSVVSIWNKWVEAYHGVGQGLFVRYESLVENPVAEMDRIASALGLSKPAHGWRIAKASAKSHGASHGRAKALDIIRKRAYLKQYAQDDLFQACVRLNSTLLALHTYDDCDRRTRLGATGRSAVSRAPT